VGLPVLNTPLKVKVCFWFSSITSCWSSLSSSVSPSDRFRWVVGTRSVSRFLGLNMLMLCRFFALSSAVRSISIPVLGSTDFVVLLRTSIMNPTSTNKTNSTKPERARSLEGLYFVEVGRCPQGADMSQPCIPSVGTLGLMCRVVVTGLDWLHWLVYRRLPLSQP